MSFAIRAMLLIVLAALLLNRMEANHVSAGGSAVGISPSSGTLDTRVEFFSNGWVPNAEVNISAAFIESYSEFGSAQFGDIIATTVSDSDGHWRVQLHVGKQLAVPPTPGFVLFRAESDDLPGYLELANGASFALVVDGQRPAGSGEIRVTVAQAPDLDERLVFLAYRGVGSSTGFNNRIGVRSIPTEVTFRLLPDGDYEVAALATGGLQPAGPGLVEVLADVCTNPGCAGFQNLFTVQRVSIRNGGVVDVSIVFGDVEALPNGGSGPGQFGWRWSWFLAVVGLAAAGTLLTVLGAFRLRSGGTA